MAPPLPVYSRDEIKSLYPHLFPERIPKDDDTLPNSNTNSTNFKLSLPNCTLYSLTQNQCTYDGNRTVCIPFKRLFARCLDEEYSKKKEVIGYKLTPSHKDFQKNPNEKFYRNIEITEWSDNDYSKYFMNDDSSNNDDDGSHVKNMETIEKTAEMRSLLADFLKTDKILEAKMNQFYETLVNERNDDN
ncbi:hypothetical protein CANARDRAFT_9744 [[Candida] arabinofermentans NRRL YB-2248]|uniref:Uncharacterized protein n=1 Tax=[Candida] arabinofermentans NRRL YB-2248 TaxID=983967 RepID=A0A1E4SV23_9ASCO|nr:hypothetical protein CANARDRAFT_9744 [[Candida] arabinofermentans NRRL YB-2248]